MCNRNTINGAVKTNHTNSGMMVACSIASHLYKLGYKTKAIGNMPVVTISNEKNSYNVIFIDHTKAGNDRVCSIKVSQKSSVDYIPFMIDKMVLITIDKSNDNSIELMRESLKSVRKFGKVFIGNDNTGMWEKLKPQISHRLVMCINHMFAMFGVKLIKVES